MSTKPCPSCSEVIPTDVDYCPFCGNSTRVAYESPEDFEVTATTTEPNVDRYAAVASSDGRAPVHRDAICMMCYVATATIGDYCEECERKLNMRPEEWAAKRQDSLMRAFAIGAAVLVALLIMVALMVHSRDSPPHHTPPLPQPVPIMLPNAPPSTSIPAAPQ
jgi:predicted amidophosphoribosyltransferase